MCFNERYPHNSKTPQRTVRRLPIIPQLAALFTNASFIVYLNDTNSRIENTFKGNKIQFLKKNLAYSKTSTILLWHCSHMLSQPHKRGDMKLNIVMLQILNFPQNITSYYYNNQHKNKVFIRGDVCIWQQNSASVHLFRYLSLFRFCSIK